MCDDCKSLTIPIGETGATGATGNIGAAGTNGTNGINGTNGTNGINGTNGTTAYKLIKAFTTAAVNQTLSVLYSERVACSANPNGCITQTTERNSFIDVHVEVWYFVLTQDSSYWLLLNNTAGINPTSQNVYSCIINATTGNMTITTGNNVGLFRVVILG